MLRFVVAISTRTAFQTMEDGEIVQLHTSNFHLMTFQGMFNLAFNYPNEDNKMSPRIRENEIWNKSATEDGSQARLCM